MSIYKKILQVMTDVEYLQKDDTVDTGMGRNYKAISEEKVTSEVRKSMIKHGLVIIPKSVIERREDFDVIRGNGKAAIDRLSTVRVVYTIADADTGEAIEAESAGTGMDSGDKGIGKALTYCYKYLLLRTFAIPTGDDPDKVASDTSTSFAKKTAYNPDAPVEQWSDGQIAAYVFKGLKTRGGAVEDYPVSRLYDAKENGAKLLDKIAASEDRSETDRQVATRAAELCRAQG